MRLILFSSGRSDAFMQDLFLLYVLFPSIADDNSAPYYHLQDKVRHLNDSGLSQSKECPKVNTYRDMPLPDVSHSLIVTVN